MTNLSRIALYSASLIVCLIIVGCTCLPWEKNCKYALIWMSAADCHKLDDVLRPFDTSLFYIQNYRKGVPKGGPRGTLTALEPGLIQKITKDAKDKKFTGCAIQGGRYKSGSSTTQVNIRSLSDLDKLKDILGGNRKK